MRIYEFSTLVQRCPFIQLAEASLEKANLMLLQPWLLSVEVPKWMKAIRQNRWSRLYLCCTCVHFRQCNKIVPKCKKIVRRGKKMQHALSQHDSTRHMSLKRTDYYLNEIQQITKCHTWQTCFVSQGSLASSHHGRVAAASVAETSGYVAWNIAAGLWARSIGVPRLTIQGGNAHEATSKNWVAFCSREGWDDS